MTRTRASAKAAGSRFERQISDYLAEVLGNDTIDRRPKRGVNDTGDIGGVKIRGHRLVLEAKDCARFDLAGWIKEAKQEAANDKALAGFVVAKRRGVTNPADQYLIGTLSDLVALITETRQEQK